MGIWHQTLICDLRLWTKVDVSAVDAVQVQKKATLTTSTGPLDYAGSAEEDVSAVSPRMVYFVAQKASVVTTVLN